MGDPERTVGLHGSGPRGLGGSAVQGGGGRTQAAVDLLGALRERSPEHEEAWEALELISTHPPGIMSRFSK
jgi:hypothetical protein